MCKKYNYSLRPAGRWAGPMVALLLAGCASTQVPPQPLALDARLQAFKTQAPEADATAVAAPAADDRWWTAFADPVLDQLVDQASTSNTDIRIAAARLAQTQALASQTGAARQPQLGLGAGAVRQQGPLVNAAGTEGTLFTAAATLSYEVDVLGRLAQAGDAAALDAQQRQSLLESARLLTQAQVVQTYVALRALDADMDLLRHSLALDRQSLRIQAYRLQSGALSELEYERLQGAATGQTLETQRLQQRRDELENTLAVLLGQAASEFRLDRTDAPDWVTGQRALPAVRAGLPSTVLQRRPDIAAAQAAVLAGQKRLGVTQSAWFPSLSLTGTTGFASAELSTLVAASMQTWAFGVLANLPVFDGGRRQAGIAMADAELSAAVASYHQHLLQALREVEDQLSAQRLLAQQNAALERMQGSAARASELSQARFDSGSISQLDWLEVQRRELQGRRQLVQLRAARCQATTGLVRALGGGWN
ncbi:RND transporter [Rhodoferax lacus]|uniref:RND transporter n=2 Tax=Rhodoferax lacus TaxID=2184758 RepID=A0A3E1RB98_9BURK|nr:RND transporter [Rhodoferax lacus]